MRCGICSKNSLAGEKRKEGEKRKKNRFFKKPLIKMIKLSNRYM